MAQYKKLSDYTVNTSPNDGDLVPLLVDNGNGTYDNALMEYSSLKGEDGMGVPSGGIGNQVLTKNSGADYDTIWSTISKSSLGLGSVTNDLQLKAASNLSDLPDKAASRTNLGLGSLALKSIIDLSSDTTGVLPEVQGGAGAINGILKANGSGNVSAATAGTDYVSPTNNAPVTYSKVITDSSPEWHDGSGFWVDVTGVNITFTTTGTSKVIVMSQGQCRNTAGGTSGTHMRLLLDSTVWGGKGRVDSPTANSIGTATISAVFDSVPAGSHTVKLQICRNEYGTGLGSGTSTIRQPQNIVQVFRTA